MNPNQAPHPSHESDAYQAPVLLPVPENLHIGDEELHVESADAYPRDLGKVAILEPLDDWEKELPNEFDAGNIDADLYESEEGESDYEESYYYTPANPRLSQKEQQYLASLAEPDSKPHKVGTAQTMMVKGEPVETYGDPFAPTPPALSMVPAEQSNPFLEPADEDPVLEVPDVAEIEWTPDAHIVLTDEQLDVDWLVADTFEKQHYIKQAPLFSGQMQETDRTNRFTAADYNTATGEDKLVVMSEHEAMVGLRDYLQGAIAEVDFNGMSELHKKFLESLEDSLTFIGEKEYAEGARGIAAYWKSFLNENSRNQICVPSNISKYYGQRKSDIYLFERVLDTFTDEELEHYQGRIKTDVDELSAKPENAKIVLLDDWTISGMQMGDVYRGIAGNPDHAQYKDRIEINLLAASADRIEHGLLHREWKRPDVVIPVKAYYKAHSGSSAKNGAHITGTHSSVDFDFESNLGQVRSLINQRRQSREETEGWDAVPRAPLTNIVRTYRSEQPRIEMLPGGVIKRNRRDL